MSLTLCRLTPGDRSKLHKNLQRDLAYQRRMEAHRAECLKEISRYYDQREQILIRQAEEYKKLLDQSLKRQLEIISLEARYVSLEFPEFPEPPMVPQEPDLVLVAPVEIDPYPCPLERKYERDLVVYVLTHLVALTLLIRSFSSFHSLAW